MREPETDMGAVQRRWKGGRKARQQAYSLEPLALSTMASTIGCPHDLHPSSSSNRQPRRGLQASLGPFLD